MPNRIDNTDHSSSSQKPEEERERFEKIFMLSDAWKNQESSISEWNAIEGKFNLTTHEVQHLNSKNAMAKDASLVFSKRAHELGIYNTKIPGRKH